MVERVDTFLVVVEEPADVSRVFRPELMKRAVGRGERSVEKHERGAANRAGGKLRQGLAFLLERRQHLRVEGVDTVPNLTVDTLSDLLRRVVGRFALEEVGDDVKRRDQHVTEHAAGGARRSCVLQPIPLKPQWNADRVGWDALECRAGVRLRLGAQEIARRLGCEYELRPRNSVRDDVTDACHASACRAELDRVLYRRTGEP